MIACSHCGLEVPAADAAADQGDDGPAFCCPGCRAAYHLIQDAGLGSYYLKRLLDPHLRPPRPDDENLSIDPGPFVREAADGSRTLNLMIEGIYCAACVWLIESLLSRTAGVQRARLNMTTRRLEIVWRPEEADIQDIIKTVTGLGYGVLPYDPALLERQNRKSQRELLRAMAVAGFAAANVMLLSVAVWSGAGEGAGGGEGPVTRSLFYWFSALIALPAILYAGRPFFRSAINVLMHGRGNMDVPISLAITLTAGVSLSETMRGGQHVYFESAIMLLFFLLVGRYLDRRARARAEAQAERLTSLTATSVTVIGKDGKRRVVPLSVLKPGMIVLAAAGERIPADGEVLTGTGDLDCSLITGESLPVAAGPGTEVHAGTLNLTGALTLRVDAAGDDTLLAGIARIMETAERATGKHVAIADRVARLYTPGVHVIALAAFAGWVLVGGLAWQEALLIATAVLIITCPCALALAVPVVQVIAVSKLMRRGVLVKSPTALERLAGIDTVAFDKTGTLTRAVLYLEGGDFNDQDFQLAARMAAASTHPLARALVRAYERGHANGDTVSPLAEVTEIPGAGLFITDPEDGSEIRLGRPEWAAAEEASGTQPGPELWLSRDGKKTAGFLFDDPPRPDAAAVVTGLARKGLGVRLLSGDHQEAVARCAAETGIANYAAGLSPQDKVRELERLASEGRRVLMAGDGLNDAPALKVAHVSASPATAADITRTAADLVFQGERLAPLAETIAIAGRAQGLIRQNLGFALLYNAVTIPLAVAGLVTPLVAAASMSASSIVVIANAMRLGND